jgi:hypothetical protein
LTISCMFVRQKKLNKRFRHRLNGFILLIAMALSIATHVSCNTWSLVGSDTIRAIGIWGVLDDNESWCQYRRSISRYEDIARTLGVLATLAGVVCFLCWTNSQYDTKPKFLALLAVLFGVFAACAEGGTMTALYQSLPCGGDDDLTCTLWGSYRTATLGGVWPMLAIVYWAAGIGVILYTVMVLGDDAIRESLYENDD